MKIKKTVKFIGKGILFLLGLLLVLLIIMFIHRQIRLTADVEYLKKQGYYNPVSVGEYSLNLLDFGNPNGKHTIIAMSGYGVPDSCITMRNMTSVFEKDNRVIFLDRAGYGASDDTENEMTAENIVEDYRKALSNAGIEAPYVLMPHSIGGVYATYWESQYPDEIEAITIIDGTEMRSMDEFNNLPNETSFEERLYKLDNIGIGHIAIRAVLPKNPNYTKDEQRIEDIMSLMTYDSKALLDEGKRKIDNISDVWDMIVTNDIPKIYICSSNAFKTKEEVIENRELDDELIYNLTEGSFFSGSDEERTQKAYENYLSDCEYMREKVLKPYAEKLGECEIILLPVDHMIYQQKPDECGKIIKDFLDKL